MRALQQTLDQFTQLFKHLSKTSGYLVGVENGQVLLNFVKRQSTSDLNKFDDEVEQVQQLLPLGLTVVGYYLSSDWYDVEDVNNVSLDKLPKLNSISKYTIVIGDKKGGFRSLLVDGSTINDVKLETSPNALHIIESKSDQQSGYVLLECSTSLQIQKMATSNRNQIVDSFISYLSENKAIFMAGNQILQSGDVLSLLPEELNLDLSDDSLLAYQPPAPREQFIAKKKQKQAGSFLIDELQQTGVSVSAINTDLERMKLVRKTVRISVFTDFVTTDQNSVQTLSTDNYPCTLKLSTICYTLPSTKVSDLLQSIQQKFIAQLKYIKANVLNTTRSLTLRVNQGPVPVHAKSIGYYHFLPNESYPHLISICYPFFQENPSEEELVEYSVKYRLSLHDRFYFSSKVPFLRIGRSLPFSTIREQGTAKTSKKLNNVHLYCKSSGLPASSTAKLRLVKGTYTYYHYKQDGFNDDQWGCAYRSLQTLISYCRYNQIAATNKPVPTIPQIQETLVNLGDKPSNFVGSKQWIGAFENSLVLESWCNVQSRILNVTNRKELLENHLRTLVRHFEDNGTPVMIGGGVLAYTMLGLDYDEVTNDVRFLILDPHYTGSDTVYQETETGPHVHTSTTAASGFETILRDGWCGWKKADEVFLDNNFYNMCMPQIPNSC